MQLKRYTSAAEFRQRALPFLLAHEVEHALMLGILGRVVEDPHAFGGDAYLALVAEAGQVVAAASMTPPFNLLLALTERPEALRLIAEDVRTFPVQPPAVNAPSEIARAFAEQWQALTGQPFRLERAMRLFRLDAVIPPRPVAGSMRRIAEADRPIIKQWMLDFVRDANLTDPMDEARREKIVSRYLAMPPDGAAGMYVWEADGQAVSMTGATPGSPSGMRVNAVYTPAEHRRKGYASALVAAVSQRILDSGSQFASLYTDLANPTSNHIYQEIGYRPVCDVDEYRFEAAGGGREDGQIVE
jgi:predicted GNAT family acetyltransferase